VLLSVRASTEIRRASSNVPILEPDLHRALSHVDLLGNPLANYCGRSGISVELDLEGDELVLGGSLAFLIFLLLGEGALARWPSSPRVTHRGRGGGRGRRHLGQVLFEGHAGHHLGSRHC
jgi:hypothetical protein